MLFYFPSDCGQPGILVNGVRPTATTTTLGSTAQVTCNSGYTPSSQNITCQANSQWTTVSCVVGKNCNLISLEYCSDKLGCLQITANSLYMYKTLLGSLKE